MMEYDNFWSKWGEFTKIKLYRDPYNILEAYFAWKKWNKFFNNRIEVNTFNGILINVEEETQEDKGKRELYNKKMNDKILIIHEILKIDLMQKYTCQIWLNQIDFKANLQWNSWNQTYWFYCLIDWLKKDNQKSCPNWRNKINSKSISINRSIETEIETLISLVNNQRAIEWKIHLKNCDVFWQTCNKETCGICMIEKMHDGHQLCSIEDQKELIIKSAEDVINSENSLKSTKKKELKRLNNNSVLAKYIKDKSIKIFKRKIESIDNDLNSEISNTHKEASEIINN